MSIPLESVNLASAQVGTVEPLDWTGVIQPGYPTGTLKGMATLRLLNESNCGLQVNMGGATGTVIPAGGWSDILLAGQNSLTVTVLYILSGPSPAMLLPVLYEPGEPVPPLPVLGNSAVGVGGNVNVSTSSAVKNDGNLPGTSIIESTPSDQVASAFALNNDGSGFWKVLSAGILRTVLNVVRGNASATKATITIGDAGDATITTYIGNLDKLRSDGGALTSDGSGNLTGNTVTAAGVSLQNGNGSLFSTIFNNNGFRNRALQMNAQQIASQATHIVLVSWDGASGHAVLGIGSNAAGDTGTYFDDNGNLIVANITAAKISSDGATITSNGSGHLTIGQLTSDGGNITSDGSGNLTTNGLNAGGNVVINTTGPEPLLIEYSASGEAIAIKPSFTGSHEWDIFPQADGTLGLFDRTAGNYGVKFSSTGALISGKTFWGFENSSGTKLAEFKANGQLVVTGSNPCFLTTAATVGFATGGVFDSFDVSEAYPVDREYGAGVVLCPHGDVFSLCEHDNCHAASITSKGGALAIGAGQFDFDLTEDELADYASRIPADQVALVGRVMVNTSDPTIKMRDLVVSDGQGGVRKAHRGSGAWTLGYALTDTSAGRVGVYVRPDWCILD